MSELKKCPECNESFNWDDQIIYVETIDDHYHEKCVELYPVKYLLMQEVLSYVSMSRTLRV